MNISGHFCINISLICECVFKCIHTHGSETFEPSCLHSLWYCNILPKVPLIPKYGILPFIKLFSYRAVLCFILQLACHCRQLKVNISQDFMRLRYQGKFVVVFIVFLRDFAVLGNHPKVFCMLGKYSSAELHFRLANFILSGFMESFLPPCYFYIFARRDIAVPDGDWLQKVYHLPGQGNGDQKSQ